MQRIDSLESLKTFVRTSTGSLALVPTMGALHAGHLSLVAAAKQRNEVVMVSIFINPTQFNQASDLAQYPQTLAADLLQLNEAGVDAVFLPDVDMIYPDDYQYQLTEKSLSQRYCGAHRPGHFDGVLTVVMKLFNLVKPNQAYFGEKDYQQLALLKGMVAAFFLDVEIIACPIMREADGLAMSSRNVRLSADARKLAPQLYATLKDNSSLSEKRHQLNQSGFDVDYLEVMHDRLLVAASLDGVRLIDNVAYPAAEVSS